MLDKALAKNGYLPNLLGILANAPAALETYLTVGEINSRSSLTLAEREAVQITAATEHACAFCVAGHTAIAYRLAKLDEPVVEALRQGHAVPDPRLQAVAEFTRAVVRAHGNVAETDLDAFRAAGFGDQQILEVVLGVSLATLCNFSNVLAHTELNPQLEPYRWQPAP